MMPSESRRWAWLTHYMMYFFALGLVFGVADLIFPGRWLGLVASVFVTLVILSYFGHVKHASMLCKRCMDSIPDDAAVLVVRRDRALRFAHWDQNNSGKILIVFMIILAIDIFFVNWLDMFLFVYLMAAAWAQRFHEKVMPWCPYCEDDDGDGVVTPDPVPTGTKVA